MNQSSSTKLLFALQFIVLPAFVVKLLWSITLFYLDKDLYPINLHESMRFNTQTKLAYKLMYTQKVPVNTTVESGKKITDFKLKGTYVSGDDSFAIIEDGEKTEFIYIGEEYQGYKLEHVYENKAIFNKDDEKYELTMYSALVDDSEGDYTMSSPKKHSAKIVASGNYTVPVDIRKEDINTYMQKPDKIWNNIRINDFRTDDGINFKVSYVRAGTIFSSIGLKSGDIITAIDGEIPQSMGDVMQYYSNIDDLKNLVLTVKRGNQELDLEFRVKE